MYHASILFLLLLQGVHHTFAAEEITGAVAARGAERIDDVSPGHAGKEVAAEPSRSGSPGSPIEEGGLVPRRTRRVDRPKVEFPAGIDAQYALRLDEEFALGLQFADYAQELPEPSSPGDVAYVASKAPPEEAHQVPQTSRDSNARDPPGPEPHAIAGSPPSADDEPSSQQHDGPSEQRPRPESRAPASVADHSAPQDEPTHEAPPRADGGPPPASPAEAGHSPPASTRGEGHHEGHEDSPAGKSADSAQLEVDHAIALRLAAEDEAGLAAEFQVSQDEEEAEKLQRSLYDSELQHHDQPAGRDAHTGGASPSPPPPPSHHESSTSGQKEAQPQLEADFALALRLAEQEKPPETAGDAALASEVQLTQDAELAQQLRQALNHSDNTPRTAGHGSPAEHAQRDVELALALQREEQQKRPETSRDAALASEVQLTLDAQVARQLQDAWNHAELLPQPAAASHATPSSSHHEVNVVISQENPAPADAAPTPAGSIQRRASAQDHPPRAGADHPASHTEVIHVNTDAVSDEDLRALILEAIRLRIPSSFFSSRD
ncbi:hypothetical protein PCASD_12328 [Puccinia coronata f. sp. avenae]|uniref:Uncharacterized protein n=1 Tax=Puccinia coronata f. sp. avenae TaxID=200324 RepID=A0A2N5TCX1_9BASI|nr:hypothetical protein PCASD_12328 [Puccinia coronata f. sp. avenae]